ncbi:peroxide stress protein YaaA [Hahella sp. CCB-MM4]|uniref:peroxide stress protein YaaA n=1 Tax=Hahella sp. (strain CCB-MM4) TaxID=1926491 RepID=UPI000B9BAC52|nr:peroxide stress protein YaaA [Hahella sp. CCB-MM4]OZG71231.1 peroxide stress protein YaaA [Hahella sp. CCB-MM4]
MLTVVSPAKTLDYESEIPAVTPSEPAFLDHSAELIDVLKGKEPWELSEMMSISSDLANLNANRYQQWSVPFTADNARPAIFAFKGDVYTGLDVETLTDEDIHESQNRLRILSGLYGVLKPLDLMQPYRLEMGTRLENPRGTNLYQFWGDTITETLNQELEEKAEPILVNLASNEYFKSVKPKKLNARVITPVFKDQKGDQYKVVSFWAKKARGLMARYIIQNRVEQPDQLKDFTVDGYRFREEMSRGDEWVFTRDH